MFETLLASPEPWLYAHVMLPGGTKNLTNPAYALGGGAAPLHGTIMQVIAVQREADSRLTLLVHGIGRCIVLRATQESPYARADVQSLPDDECLVSCAHRVLGFLGAKAPEVPRAIRRRLLMASAASENLHWRQYEFANHTLSQHLSLSLCDSSEVARGCRDTADAAHTEAMLAMPLAPPRLGGSQSSRQRLVTRRNARRRRSSAARLRSAPIRGGFGLSCRVVLRRVARRQLSWNTDFDRPL